MMRTLGIVALVVGLAAPAAAQQLQLTFQDGRVTMDASNVPVRTILSEWARIGGTTVVNGDKISGAPVTLHLEGVPENQALEVILRSVAGYMAAPRRAASTGASNYDRILVMPTSSAPAATTARSAPRGPNAAPRIGRQGFQPPTPQPVDEAVDTADVGVNEPPQPFQFPEQNPFQAVGQPTPFGTPVMPPQSGQTPVFQFTPAQQQDGGFGSPSGVSVNPAPPQQMPVLQFPGAQDGAGGGFGTMGSPMPGVVVQPPQQPGQRPPGGAQ
ncbi:MAG: hypothetical protein R2712_14740 [Vicinamibacterales bacterium]